MSGKVISSWNEQGSVTIPHLYKDEGDAAFGALLMRKYFEFANDSESRIKVKARIGKVITSRSSM